MATEVTLPALGESVTEGTVTRWLKQVGDTISVDEPLLEVSTDKVDTEIPSPVAGTLLEIKADEDDTVEVGAVLALVGDEGESAGDSDGSEESGGSEDDEAQDTSEQDALRRTAPSKTVRGAARTSSRSGLRPTPRSRTPTARPPPSRSPRPSSRRRPGTRGAPGAPVAAAVAPP